MKQRRLLEVQIIKALKEYESGRPAKEICCEL
jgi:hypothetical protein